MSMWLSAALRRQIVSEVLDVCQCPRAGEESKKSGPEAREDQKLRLHMPENSETDPALISAVTEDCISGKPCPHPL